MSFSFIPSGGKKKVKKKKKLKKSKSNVFAELEKEIEQEVRAVERAKEMGETKKTHLYTGKNKKGKKETQKEKQAKLKKWLEEHQNIEQEPLVDLPLLPNPILLVQPKIQSKKRSRSKSVEKNPDSKKDKKKDIPDEDTDKKDKEKKKRDRDKKRSRFASLTDPASAPTNVHFVPRVVGLTPTPPVGAFSVNPGASAAMLQQEMFAKAKAMLRRLSWRIWKRIC